MYYQKVHKVIWSGKKNSIPPLLILQSFYVDFRSDIFQINSQVDEVLSY